VDWYTQGGARLITQIGADLSAISGDSAAGHTADALGRCRDLGDVTGAARNYPRIPDPEAQKDWSAALGQLATGALDCQAGRFDRSGSEIREAGGYMRQATDRVNELTGSTSGA